MADHRPGHVFVVVLAFFVFVGTVAFSVLRVIPIAVDLGLYDNSDLYDITTYNLSVTPVIWTYVVLQITVAVYQTLWLLYALTTLCRTNTAGDAYVYDSPVFMPAAMYVLYTISLLLHVAYIFVHDMENLVVALVLIGLSAVFVSAAMAVSFRSLYAKGAELLRSGGGREVRLVRGLVQNGMGHLAAWSWILTLIALAVVLHWEADVSEEDASTIVLALTGLLLILYFILDTLVLDHHTRYLLTPYVALVSSLIGILVGNVDGGGASRVLLISAVVLGLAAAALLFKLVLILGRWRSDPDPIKRAPGFKPTAAGVQ